jgi:hypothetical protein
LTAEQLSNPFLAYLVELFPFAERARGVAVEQFFGRGAGFFSTYVNPIALKAITWKYLAVYCGWIAIEVMFVYFFYPETQGRTLEELAFCKLGLCTPSYSLLALHDADSLGDSI